MKDEKIERTNPEKYIDLTPHDAIKSIDGAEKKAYQLYNTISHMARLAGFTIIGAVEFADRNGVHHNSAHLKDRFGQKTIND